MIVCEINTRRAGCIMKHLPHGRRVHVGGALNGVRQGAGQDAAAGLLVHRSRHRLADQGGCRSRVIPWRRFSGHESHGVDIRPAPQHSQHGGATEDAFSPDWRTGVHRWTVSSTWSAPPSCLTKYARHSSTPLSGPEAIALRLPYIVSMMCLPRKVHNTLVIHAKSTWICLPGAYKKHKVCELIGTTVCCLSISAKTSAQSAFTSLK